MNRRASDSGAHLLLFQQQYGVTGSNTLGAVHPTHSQSPSSNVKITIQFFLINLNIFSSDHLAEVSHVVHPSLHQHFL